jgi:NAD(P)-dependent dehydrogenase (short-subunit alcohol dehydrogenase family)
MSVTIINGGTQGLGEAVARKLTSQGAKGLVLAGRSADRGKALASELTGLGTRSIYFEADISDPAAPQAIVDACDAEFGTVEALVNIAAKTSRANLFQDTPEHFDQMMTINVKAPYFLIQAATRVMVRDGVRGSIVNIGSTSGEGGQPKLAAYSISKGALAVMTRNLAFALMRHGIRVNQVNPGWMDTESEHTTQITWDKAPDDWLVAAEAGRPFGRLVKPWEVANTIAFCLSDESGVLTGNVINVDQSVHGAGDPPIPTEADLIHP